MGGALQRAAEQAGAAGTGAPGHEGAGKRKVPRWLLLPLQIGVMFLLRRGMQAYMATGGLFGNSTGVPVLQLPPGRTWPTTCAFTVGQRLSLYVYTSHSAVFHGSADAAEAAEAEAAGQALVWAEHGLAYDWSAGNDRAANVTLRVTPRLLANESVYAHVFLVKGARRVPRTTEQCRGSATVACHTIHQTHMRYNLTEHCPPPKPKHLKHLITGQEDNNNNDNETQVEASARGASSNGSNETDTGTGTEEKPWVMLWKPSMDIRVLADAQTVPLAQVPDMLRGYWGVDFDAGVYWPPLVVNTFALRHEAFVPVNATVAELPLALHYAPISFWKFTLAVQMEQQLRAQARLAGGAGGAAAVEQEIDDIKSMLTETNPVLLAVTAVVSLVHSLFDFLAFKNDIAFWRARRSDLRGISVSTVVFDAVAHVVVLLYLWDNNTSLLVLVPAALAALVDCWKVVRALTLRRRCARASASASASAKAGTADETAETDRRAYRWLLALLAPVVLGYTSYTLVRVPQRSWGSWLLGSLTSLVHALGFVMMTPQLVVNHRLKTVAHLPWRALVYRALNTFIDDLFAFVIRMPTMHRISCFRDDIVFFIYLYQRWKYPVDKSRCADDDTGGTPAKTKKTQ